MAVSNRILRVRRVRGEEAYIYGLKERAKRHHCLGYGTFSVDLTALEALRRQYSRTVRPITSVPVYIKATALAIARHPEANAILFKRPFGLKIAQFEQVDVNLPITRRASEGRADPFTFIGTVRGAGEKSLAGIQDELVALRRGRLEDSFAIRRYERLARMPLWMARLVHSWMTRSPSFYLKNVGTCGLTFVEGDWYERIFPIAPTSVVFGIGGARREPVVVHHRIEIRRVLKCTLMVDNYVVQGPTAARLAKDFKSLLEEPCFIRDEIPATRRAEPGLPQDADAGWNRA